MVTSHRRCGHDSKPQVLNLLWLQHSKSVGVFHAKYGIKIRVYGKVFSVDIGEGTHPFPFRIRQLSLLPAMVLTEQFVGRVASRRDFYKKPCSLRTGLFFSMNTGLAEQSEESSVCELNPPIFWADNLISTSLGRNINKFSSRSSLVEINHDTTQSKNHPTING